MIRARARNLADMGDLSDTVASVANDLTGGQFDVVSAQVQTIQTELKIALAASYVAGALALVVLVRRL
jgi:hypothetical protein